MIQDLRIGFRVLRTRPGFSFVAVLTLALGIGAATVIFSVVNGVLLRPLPLPESDRLVRIEEQHDQSVNPSNLTHASFFDLIENTSTLEHLSAARFWTTNLADGDEPEQVSSLLVTADYFSALGVSPAIGRNFLTEEDQPGRGDVVIISNALWQRRYGADPDVIGKTINANGRPMTVVGVLPAGFRSGYPFQGDYDVWSPLVPGTLRSNRVSHLLGVIGRIKPDFTIDQSRSELATIATSIIAQNPGVDDPVFTIGAVRLQDRMVSTVRPAIFMFLSAVGLLLLIACANVANLLLARAASRQREMAIRSALGAGRVRLARQLLTESLLLGGLGGIVGLILAFGSLRLVTSLSPANFPRMNEVNIDVRVMVFAILVSLLTGLIFGLAPIIQLPGRSFSESLKDGSRGTGSRKGWLLNGLVAFEVSLTLIVLIGAGLLINSFLRVMQENRGFDPANVLTVNLNLPVSKYGTGAQQTAVLQQMLERVRAVPGAQSVGLTNVLPFSGGPATTFEIAGRPPVEPGNELTADIRIIDSNYFKTLAVPLRSGRTFTEQDTADAPRVMIINAELARQYWAGEDPIGRRVTMLHWGPPLTGEVVGVVGDVKSDGIDSTTRPMIYWPHPQFPSTFNNLVIRAAGDPSSIVAGVKSQIWSVDREQPLNRIETMEKIIANSAAPRRFYMFLLATFAFLSLALAAVGIYGVISYTAAQRTREIGVRVALGAQRGDVISMVVREGMLLALVGVVIGLTGAFGLTRLMTGLLYGVEAADPLTFGVISVLLSLVALVACYVPARRAAGVDPLTALRCD
jgi:putative ABC transport system permease protein